MPTGSRGKAVTGEELRLSHIGVAVQGISWAPKEVGILSDWSRVISLCAGMQGYQSATVPS